MIIGNDNKYHILYITTNILNGKYYKGKHSTTDLNDGYLGSGLRLNRAIKKYGVDIFKREIVEYLPDPVSLDLKEKEFITEEDLNNPSCYNIAVGGTGGNRIMGYTDIEYHSFCTKMSKILKSRTEEYLKDYGKKISDAHKNRSPEKEAERIRKILESSKNRSDDEKRKTKEKRSIRLAGNKYRLGQNVSEETRKKMSESHKGKQVSEETKKRMSKAQQNRPPITDKTRKKLSDSHKGKKASEETRKKMSETRKRNLKELTNNDK